MAFRTDIKIRDTATPALQARLARIISGAVNPRIGRAVTVLLQQHFIRLDSERANDLGGRRTHFYGAVARSVHYTEKARGVDVGITHLGIRQRLRGGPIRPGAGGSSARLLTIPAIAAAYGKRAREFSNLRLVMFPGRGQLAGMLTEKPEGATTSEGKAIKGRKKYQKKTGFKNRVFYWLLRSVNQRPDPSVMPGRFQIVAEARRAIMNFIRRKS